jgi:hypothetical protein
MADDSPWGPTIHKRTVASLTDSQRRALIRVWYPDVADRLLELIDRGPDG